MYHSIEELPYNVRQALGPLSESWMAHYNNALEALGESQLAKLQAWRNIRQETDDVRWFESYATCQIKDSHGEVLDTESIARCMPAYIDGGGELAVSHRAGTYGTVYDYEIAEHPLYQKPAIYIYGALYRGRPSWDRLWGILQSKKEGDRIPLAVSIGGSMKAGVQWVCDNNGECEDRVITDDLREISVTYSPANHAAVGHANALAKEDNRMTEEEVTKTEGEEPNEVEALKAQVSTLVDEVSLIKSNHEDIQKALSDLGTAIENLSKAKEEPDEEPEEEEDEEKNKTEEPSDEIVERLKAVEDFIKAQAEKPTTPEPEVREPTYDKTHPDPNHLVDELFKGGRL